MTTRGLKLAVIAGAALALRAGAAGAWGMPPPAWGLKYIDGKLERATLLDIHVSSDPPKPLTGLIASSPLGNDGPGAWSEPLPDDEMPPGIRVGPQCAAMADGIHCG